MAGMVYLVGAGPGDPGMLTLRGAEVLSKADVVLYDGLVNEAILQHAPLHSIRVCVGKRGHGGAWTQLQIDDLTVAYALQHSTVVRLKGGDTAIFARTSEETERLVAEGIAFEVVPGITAALAASAFAGIPLTHRDWSSSVAFVTGQLQPNDGYGDSEDSMDWASLARFPGTLVMYMAVSSAAKWSQQLIDAGKASNTPVALIRRCSWPDQQVLRCELGRIGETLETHREFKPPVISIVGEVVRSPTSSWFEAKPLFGKTLLVTSPRAHSESLGRAFEERGAHVLRAPALSIEPPEDWNPVDVVLRDLSRFDWIVFSSRFGVDAFFERLMTTGFDARALRNSKVAAVGKSTAQSMQPYGIRCDLFPMARAGADSLLALMEPLVRGQRVLLVRNPDGVTKLDEGLSALGCSVQNIDVYRQMPVEQWPARIDEAVANATVDWAVVTSGNSATNAVRLMGEPSLDMHWLAISPGVASQLRDLGCRNVIHSEEPNHQSLVEALINKPVPFGSSDV
jgi:uroporphyrinogen III methyltransferase/synthase